MSDTPAAIVPETKDWTWVIQRPCPECAHVSSRNGVPEAPAIIDQVVDRLTAVLARDGIAVRTRPDRWSELEYVCHVRDVFVRYEERIALMLDHDDPLFPNWDQDTSAVDDDYAGQDPAVVAAELRAAADVLNDRLRALTPDQLDRPGRRSDGASFTVDSIVRYMVHDPVHHVWDVDGGPIATS